MTRSPSAEDELRAILSTKTWFGFDLDDTLHEFRSASRAATTHCLGIIAKKNSHISLQDLQDRYQEVLKHGTGNAFVDGKTSHDYRRARFVATLEHFSLNQDSIDDLLHEYERVLVENLRLKPGVKSLLQTIKSSGRKIVVVTEGPQDAQDRAVRDLGIAEYLDFLATTNYFGVAKTTGLFGKVLAHLGIQPEEIVHVGDSLERDIVPGREAGMDAIHFDEKQVHRLKLNPPAINSLGVIEECLLPF